MKCKWIFDIKRSGVFRARLVACGYSQVPGLDFTDIYSPVVNDITIRCMVIAEMVWKFSSMVVDVETAFLHGDLEEEIYMESPEGLGHSKEECVRLMKTLYGLVQSGRAFNKKLTGILKDLGFTQSLADPCLFIRRNEHGRVYITLWVDDCYIMGDVDAIDDAVKQIEKSFTLKKEYSLKDFLSCEVIFDKHKEKCWIGQPHMVRKIEKTFAQLVKGLPKHNTPGTPGHVLQKAEKGQELDLKTQATYRSGTGMLLYLVKYSRPDIANAVRELTKGMQACSEDDFKEMKRVIKYVLDTKDYGLKMEPQTDMIDKDTKWELVVYSDSDWAGDKSTRKSVTGYGIFLLGCPIMWKSKQQQIIAMSLSEAEYIACTDAVKEILFITQVIESMKIQIKKPIIVRVDNVGAIFMAENISATARTKHVDMRLKFINQYIEDGIIKIVFVKGGDNKSDPLTKNVNKETNNKHSEDYIAEKEWLIPKYLAKTS